MGDMKDLIDKYAALLPIGTSVSYTEAERRSGEFLSAQAIITDMRLMLSNEKIKLLTVQTATFAVELSKGTAKTVTENKLTAESSPEYIKAREELERVENELSYLKSYYEIFGNAAVFYRQMARGEVA